MSKRILIGLALFISACPSVWSARSVVAGVLKNALPNDRVEVFVPHYYMDARSDTYRAVLQPDHTFHLVIEVPEPQLVFLVHNEDRLSIFIEPNDSLYVSSDLFQFPLVTTFEGQGAANNRMWQEFMREQPQDFNEFNNIRFKIGQLWIGLEAPINSLMETMQPDTFQRYLAKRQRAGFALLDDFEQRFPETLSQSFRDWFTVDVLYQYAYHLLVYGHVYRNRYKIEEDFFEWAQGLPLSSEFVSNDWYRQFIGAYMARVQSKQPLESPYYAGQYFRSDSLLTGKAHAYFGSEIIRLGFGAERYQEILPCYTAFLQTNQLSAFDQKVAPLYEKSVRVSPGITAPVFAGKDINGNNVSLGEFRGKVVYLNFWASWCGACLRKMELFDLFANELNTQGIEIVNISIDATAEPWRKALSERAFKGRHLLAKEGFEQDLAKIFGVEAVPQYFIIDKQGSFASKPYVNQPDEIRKALLELTGGVKSIYTKQ